MGTETGEEGGEGWKISEQSGTDRGALMSVWGASPARVWAVGGQPKTPETDSQAAMIVREEETWTDVELPPDTAMLNWIYGVEDEVWVVGQSGNILRLDGDAWVHETSPTDRTLWGVWGASAQEVWAVGGNGTSDEPLLFVRRDDAWMMQEVPAFEAEPNGLFKVWGTAEDDVWVVGDRGVSLHYDGETWTASEIEEGADLISVWGSESQGVVAVGGRANGHVARRTSDAWDVELLPVAGLNGIWIDEAKGITAVGSQGLILRIEGDGFEYEVEDSPTPLSLHAVFGFDDGPRYAVGGTLLLPPPWAGVVLVSE